MINKVIYFCLVNSFICWFLFLIICLSDVTNWKLDSKNLKAEINDIYKTIKVNEKEESDKTVIVNQDTSLPKSDSYWDYIKMNLIDVDFKELKAANPDTRGWIQVNGTNINYPFVQSIDNDYYLNHTFNRTINQAGWVFLDYRNDIDNLAKNNILYAHGRLDKTMFGSLKNIFRTDWLNDQNNYVVKLSTEKQNTLWQVFSIYIIPTTNDYIKISFDSNYEFNEWANALKNRSNYNFNTEVNELDKILTLSTCYNELEKVVLHAKLIKIEEK